MHRRNMQNHPDKNQRTSKTERNEVLKHFQSVHKIFPELHHIEWKTLGTGYISALHRKKHEEILIKNDKPKINIIYNS